MTEKKIRMWSVAFGGNYASRNVIARTAEEAIKKARVLIDPPPKERWASKVSLIAEATP